MPEDERGRETPFVVFYAGGSQFGFGVRINDVESFGVTERGAYIRMRSGDVIDPGTMSFEHLASILGHELS